MFAGIFAAIVLALFLLAFSDEENASVPLTQALKGER
jgi:hypothetical protein